MLFSVKKKEQLSEFSIYKKKINWLLITFILSLITLMAVIMATSRINNPYKFSFDAEGKLVVSKSIISDIFPKLDLPLGDVPEFVYFAPGVPIPPQYHGHDALIGTPIPTGGYTYTFTPQGARGTGSATGGTYVAGMAGWNQDAFIKAFIKALTEMNSGLWMKQLLSWMTIIIIPVFFVSYLINYILVNFSTGGLNQLIFNGNEFDLSQIPAVFWIVCISIPLVILTVFLFQTFRLMSIDSKDTPLQKMKGIMMGSIKTISMIFLIPFGFWMLGTGLNIAITYISFISTGDPDSTYYGFTDNIYKIIFFDVSVGNSTEFSQRYPLIWLLFAICVLGESKELPNIPGIPWNPSEGVNKWLQTIGTKVQYGGLIGLAAGVLLVVLLLGLFASIIEKLFWLFINFVISIYFACISAVDGGNRLKSQQNKIIAKVVSIALIILCMNLVNSVSNALNGFIALPPGDAIGGKIFVPVMMTIVSLAIILGIKRVASEVESAIGETSNFSRVEQNFKQNSRSAGAAISKTTMATNPGMGVTQSVIGSAK